MKFEGEPLLVLYCGLCLDRCKNRGREYGLVTLWELWLVVSHIVAHGLFLGVNLFIFARFYDRLFCSFLK